MELIDNKIRNLHNDKQKNSEQLSKTEKMIIEDRDKRDKEINRIKKAVLLEQGYIEGHDNLIIELTNRVSNMEKKLTEFEIYLNSINNYCHQLSDNESKLKALQQELNQLKISVNSNITADNDLKWKAMKLSQDVTPIQKAAAAKTNKPENTDIKKSVYNRSPYSFMKDYYDLEDKEFKEKYKCKEMNFRNFSEVRNGDSDIAEFIEEAGNFFSFTVDFINYLLPKKYFLEKQNSRMVVSKIFDIDHVNKGQLMAKQVISPDIIKKKDARIWICLEKGKISQ